MVKCTKKCCKCLRCLEESSDTSKAKLKPDKLLNAAIALILGAILVYLARAY